MAAPTIAQLGNAIRKAEQADPIATAAQALEALRTVGTFLATTSNLDGVFAVGTELASLTEVGRSVWLALKAAERTAPVAPSTPLKAEPTGDDIADGTYTVVLPGTGHRTLRIQTQPDDASFAPGKRIASYLNGPDNWHNYQGFAFIMPGNEYRVWSKHQSATTVIAALAVLLSGGREAMIDGLRAYGIESGTCGVCGRKLTTPASIELGIGPICAERLGL